MAGNASMDREETQRSREVEQNQTHGAGKKNSGITVPCPVTAPHRP
jgi:hypothetical protein